MKSLFNEMANLVSRGESFALATVITRNGSAPRATGARMLVRQDHTTCGTVGGGILEAQVEQLAAKILHDRQSVVQSFEFSGQDASTMDAICGGQVEVLLEWVNGTDADTARLFSELNSAVKNRQKVWLVTELPSDQTSGVHVLLRRDGMLTGELPSGFTADSITEIRRPGLLLLEQKQYYVDPIDLAGTVYIFGAGHVSRSLAEFTRLVGFWTVVLDDRADFACQARFPTADELIVLDTFEKAFTPIEVDGDSFLVIVTRGHMHDHTVLSQALHTCAGYIGMIGSRRKCRLIFEALRQEGFTEEDIQRVHAPIGIPIEAETPEEIGVSIVAEMIQVRAGIKRAAQ